MYYRFDLLPAVITIGAAMGAVLGTTAYLILLERKLAAYVQDRLGPNRVGPWGLLQPMADGLKFFLKEEIIPSHVDRLFYLVAPGIAVSTALLAFAVVPFGPTTPPPSAPWPQTVQEAEALAPQAVGEGAALVETDFQKEVKAYNQTFQFVIAPHVDVGLAFIFAVGSLAVYAIILGGWSSNNKYSLLGALRSTAQLISYEIPLGMSALAVILLSGSLNLETIIAQQAYAGWYLWYQPVAFLLFLTSVFAECNRLPFDLPEAEQELVGGYHTEYSAMKFAMFFLGEYTHMITTSFLVVALFLGGWHLPWIAEPGVAGAGLGTLVLKLVIFAAKMVLFILVYMFVRWTIPRFRFDQLMELAWRVMIPLALVNLVGVMVVKHAAVVYGLGPWVQIVLLLAVSAVLFVGTGWLVLRQPERHVRTIVVTRGHERIEIAAR